MLLTQARALGLPIVGGSDAHHWLQTGVRHTLMHVDEIRCIVTLLKSDQRRLDGLREGPVHSAPRQDG